jgi:hypothetical protein
MRYGGDNVLLLGRDMAFLYYKVLCHCSARENEETHEKSQDSFFPGQGSNFKIHA